MSAVRLLYGRTLSPREPLSYVSTPIIRFASWSPWSHQAIVMEDGESVIDATFTHGGVRQRLLADVLAASSHWALRTFDVPDPEAAYAFARAQLGKPYDKSGVLGLALHRDWQEDDAWWCSEIAEAFLAAGRLVRFLVDANRITPQDSWKVAQGVTGTTYKPTKGGP